MAAAVGLVLSVRVISGRLNGRLDSRLSSRFSDAVITGMLRTRDLG